MNRAALSWRVIDVDLDAGVPAITLTPGEAGAGLVVRREGEPVGFAMIEGDPGHPIDPQRLTTCIASACTPWLVERAIRQVCWSTAPAGPCPTVSLVICTRDRAPLLERCLRSVMRLRDTGDTLCEVLVVDNDPSDDRTARVVEDFPGVRYEVEPRVGLDFARNRAWRASRGHYIAYVDDDAVVDSAWLEGYRHTLTVHPDAGMVTGLVLPLALDTEAQRAFERRGGFQRGFGPRRFTAQSASLGPWYPTGAGIFGAGCNMVIRRDLIAALGGFDEALDTGAPLPGGGDLDIFYRVIRAGAPLVYAPRLLVFHEHRRTMTGLRRQYYTWGLGFLAFVSKTWESDPVMRPRLAGLVRWWVADLARQVVAALKGRGHCPAHFLVGELCGGLVGVLGAYRRSQRRVAAIRAREPEE